MTVQITIIGLGEVGASVGLALKDEKQFVRVGHDQDSGMSSIAKRASAIDKVAYNLPSAVREADVILLAVPLDQCESILKLIIPDLKEGVVILDTAPARVRMIALAEELLPEGRHYVGFTPLVGPLALHHTADSREAADAALLDHGLVAITSPVDTPAPAIKLAADLAEILKATPLFADPVEVDSYMSALHLLPQLLSAALCNASVKRTGWLEGRKFAGRSFALGTLGIEQFDPPAALAAATHTSQEHALRQLDEVIAELQALRADLAADSPKALADRLEEAQQGRSQWWSERGAANWINDGIADVDIDAAQPSLLGRFGSRGKKKDED